MGEANMVKVKKDDVMFLLALLPVWMTSDALAPGYCPTMYGTGSHHGDLRLIRRVSEIRAAVEGGDDATASDDRRGDPVQDEQA
jgi:hypothetical protein